MHSSGMMYRMTVTKTERLVIYVPPSLSHWVETEAERLNIGASTFVRLRLTQLQERASAQKRST